MSSLNSGVIDWIVYGQTELPDNSHADNPKPNGAGLVGEIRHLPYRVPPGHVLVIEQMGIEGNAGGISGIMPWLGETCGNGHGLPSIASAGGSVHWKGLGWKIKGGSLFNIRLMNNSGLKTVHGWFVSGYVAPNH